MRLYNAGRPDWGVLGLVTNKKRLRSRYVLHKSRSNSTKENRLLLIKCEKNKAHSQHLSFLLVYFWYPGGDASDGTTNEIDWGDIWRLTSAKVLIRFRVSTDTHLRIEYIALQTTLRWWI